MTNPDWHTRDTDNGDGTHTLSVQRGQNADCSLHADALILDGESFTHGTRLDDGSFTRHPCRINLHNSRTPLRFERADGSKFMLRPIAPNTVHATVSGNRATYADFWDGVDCERVVTPEGLCESLTITSAAGLRSVAWAATGDVRMACAPFVQVDDFATVAVPYTFASDTLTYDLSGLAVGSVVQTWLR